MSDLEKMKIVFHVERISVQLLIYLSLHVNKFCALVDGVVSHSQVSNRMPYMTQGLI
jgi:hypothetical protein